MKTAFALLGILLLSGSCTITKQRYSSGYHVEFRKRFCHPVHIPQSGRDVTENDPGKFGRNVSEVQSEKKLTDTIATDSSGVAIVEADSIDSNAHSKAVFSRRNSQVDFSSVSRKKGDAGSAAISDSSNLRDVNLVPRFGTVFILALAGIIVALILVCLAFFYSPLQIVVVIIFGAALLCLLVYYLLIIWALGQGD